MNMVRTPGRMTTAEFMAWEAPAPHERLWVLVDGEPTLMNAPSVDHGTMQARLAAVLQSHLDGHRPECRVIVTPGIVPRARSGYNLRIPDIAVQCGLPKAAALLDDPLLLAEILSPSNERITRNNMWTYTSIPSVMELLLLDGTALAAEVLRRNADGTWPDDPEEIGADAALVLRSVGLSVRLRDLYRGTSLAGR